MSTSMKLIGSAVIVILTSIVLVGIPRGAVDVPDGVILVAALAILTRTAMHSASGTEGRRHRRE